MDFDEAVLSHESFVSRRYANSFLQVAGLFVANVQD